LLALLGAHHILHVGRIRVKKEMQNTGYKNCSKQAFFMEMMKAGTFTYWQVEPATSRITLCYTDLL